MRRGGRILIFLGLILATITAVGIFLVLMQEQPARTVVPTRSVIVALQNIPGRSEIAAEAVGKQDWPEAALPPGTFEKTEDVVGKMTYYPIHQGQIILKPMIVDKGELPTPRSSAAFVIPQGKVAVAFPISELIGVAGALQAGDSVDILLTLLPEISPPPTTVRPGTTVTVTTGAEGLAVTQLMLQDVLVLQVGSWAAASQDKNAPVGNIVTFVLDRQDALALKTAREQGKIEFALRPANDHKTFTTEPVNLQYLNKRFNFNLTPALTR